MFIKYNANPFNSCIDDCLIRAITLGTRNNYFDVFDDMCEIADEKGWEIDALRTGSYYLSMNGFDLGVPNQPVTVKQFSNLEKGPRIVIVNGHATFTKDGSWDDTWNCARYRVKYVFRKINS